MFCMENLFTGSYSSIPDETHSFEIQSINLTIHEASNVV